MKFFNRGLFALIFTIYTHTTLSAEYLYKDEIIHNPKFTTEVNKLGSELYEKTGISLRLLMLKELPTDMNIVLYQEQVLKNFSEPTVILVFSEMNSQVDIMANDSSLYKYFNKRQVLSPVASPVQAYVMAMIYAKSYENFKELSKDSGGTILPLLADRKKKGEIVGQYSGSMFNGYIDVAAQIASAKEIDLDYPTGGNNNYVFFIVKSLFYGVVLLGIIMYVRKKLYLRKMRLEEK